MATNLELVSLRAGTESYPPPLTRYLAEDSPPVVMARGRVEVLRSPLLGFFCSVRCPGDALLATYDVARALRDAGIPVIGGFHSPMEKECLAFLLRGTQPVVACPARSLEEMRVPAAWRPALVEGHLLLLSPFAARHRRATSDLARERNVLVAALAAGVFLSHAEPGGKTEALARQVLAWGKPVWTLDCAANRHLIDLGVRPITPTTVADAWKM